MGAEFPDKQNGMRVRVALVFFLTAAPAAAQVNVEPLRAKLKSDGAGGSLDVKLSGRTGNNQGLTAGGSGLVGVRGEPHFAFVSASAEYASYFGKVQASRYFAHARYNYTVAAPVWAELFGQLEHDRFARLTLRELGGVGPRVQLFSDEGARAFVSTAYMLEHETLDLPPTAPDDRDTLAHRSSTTLAGLVKVDDRIVLTATALIQPRFDRPKDYRALLLTSAEFAITKRLAASVNLSLRHDSEPPTGVKRTDLAIDNQLGLRF